MWCQYCQQDVPAGRAAGQCAPACARCGVAFAVARPDDRGIELDAVHCASAARDDAHADPARADDDRDPLAALAEKLRPRRRIDPAFGRTAPFRWSEGAAPLATAVSAPPRAPAAPPVARQSAAWAVALLLWGGAGVFLAGALAMTWAAALAVPSAWQWGLSTTIFGEGMLILGLSLAAVRLWRNSRRINRQLEGVGAQIDELGDLAGRLAMARMSCSQAYYEHFGATASPSLTMANLRGQLDQLAARIER
ncbi:MAG: hypothetical protein KF847_01345 [Pirellulales bacterium]|nr:hypothetical protein [Pirellulales bacterium]